MAKENSNGANLGFESELWRAADALRSNMAAAEYKHVVLGLIFLKYISDAFDDQHAKLEADRAQGAEPEDPDEYRAVSIFGQESNHTTWRLAKVNLAIRQIENNLGKEHADSFHRDLNPDLKADYVIANPPFNDSDWRGELLKDDKRWKFGTPPAGDANFAWVQHFIHHLSPTGLAGFGLANGSMSSNQSGEGETRKNIIESDLVDCMVAMPGQLFYSTQIPVCLWFIAREKKNGRFRDRRGQTLFIDARKLGAMIDRVHRELTGEDIRKIADTCHAWREDKSAGDYEDMPGFCRSATLDDIHHHNHILTPGRYVGAAEVEDDGEPFEEKMARLTVALREQTEEAEKLDRIIWANPEDIGYGG